MPPHSTTPVGRAAKLTSHRFDSRMLLVEKGFADKTVRGTYKSANLRQQERHPERGENAFQKRYQSVRRPLLRALVQEPPQDDGQMKQIEQPAQGLSKLRRRS